MPPGVVAPINPSLLPNLDAARRALAAARSIDEIKEIRDQAEALRAYVQAAGYGLEMQNDVAEIKLRAERRAGELLAQVDRQQRGRPEKTLHDASISRPRLQDLGIEATQSHRWQQLAKVPEPVFEQHVATVKAERSELTSASVLDLARDMTRVQRAANRSAREALRATEPVPEVPIRLEVADATDLPLSDGSVNLIVTSPPYGLDKPYAGVQDLAGGWREFMVDWLAEAYRVAAPGGRLAVNVPLDTTRPSLRPTYAQTVFAALEVGWSYRASIVWNEGNVIRGDQYGSLARGSVDSSSAPHVVAPVEMVPLFVKGEWNRGGGDSDLTHEEWLHWTNGLWTFPGESRSWEGHPAPFPLELPRRLIKLLSFRGDTVLDPFAGSGTTLVAAHQLGRVAVGVDLSPDYVASAKRRIAEAIHATA